MNQLLTLLIATLTTTVFGQVEQKQNPTDFLPKGYVVFEKIYGDLNKDGIDDCVLIIKGTDKNQIVTDEDSEQLDRNRRGIIVLFNKNGNYELASKNYNCFSSENEDGGNYFAPELSVEIENGNLLAHYGNGRYGWDIYIFRFQKTDFELIGYEQGNSSSFVSNWATFDEVSINFLTKKKLTKEVIKVTTDGKETYREVWKNVSINRIVKLSEIKDFDELDVDNLIKEK